MRTNVADLDETGTLNPSLHFTESFLPVEAALPQLSEKVNPALPGKPVMASPVA